MCDKVLVVCTYGTFAEHMVDTLDKAGVKHRAPSSFLNLILTPSIDNFPT